MTQKKETVHYNKDDRPRAYGPACGAAPPHSKHTRDRRAVTCENCKNSLAWKGRDRP